MKLPKRKQLRLEEYDYSQNGAYFVTICAHKYACQFGKIVGGGVLDAPRVELSDYGTIIKEQIEKIKSFYAHLDINKCIIMPKHTHLILIINNENKSTSNIPSCGTSRTPSPTNSTIPNFVSTLKRYTNKKAERSMWQRGYHDHIIQTEESYQKIWQYIDTNALKWQDDCYYNE